MNSPSRGQVLAFLVQEQVNHLRRCQDAQLGRVELARLAQYLAQDLVGSRCAGA